MRFIVGDGDSRNKNREVVMVKLGMPTKYKNAKEAVSSANSVGSIWAKSTEHDFVDLNGTLVKKGGLQRQHVLEIKSLAELLRLVDAYDQIYICKSYELNNEYPYWLGFGEDV